MSTTRFILVTLICLSPVILLADGLITQGLVAWVAAVALVFVARSLRPGEAGFLLSRILPAAAVAAIPALLILIQLLPLKVLAHPIWASAEQALGHPVAGTISIDPGQSVIALGKYLFVAAVALLSAAVAVDRQRAEWLLFSLTAAGAAIGLGLLAHDVFFPGVVFGALPRAQATDCTAMGAIFSSAALIRTIERSEAGSSGRRRLVPPRIAAASAALAICVAALILDATHWTLFALGCGLGAFGWMLMSRRFARGPLGAAVMAVLALGVAYLAFAYDPPEHGRSPTVAFAPSTSMTALSERVLADAPLFGTGAGTFAAVAPIYREKDDPPPGSTAPTAAAAVAIELGKPMFFLIMAATAAVIFVLLRASLRRGRDSFYPAMAGSCLVALLLLAFTNAGLLGTATGLIAAAMLGLGLAQSKSRTAQS